MLKMEIEEKIIGPLARPGVLRKLEAAVKDAVSLPQVAAKIDEIPTLMTYKGGSHVAVHERWTRRGGAVCGMGFIRLAIITEEV